MFEKTYVCLLSFESYYTNTIMKKKTNVGLSGIKMKMCEIIIILLSYYFNVNYISARNIKSHLRLQSLPR